MPAANDAREIWRNQPMEDSDMNAQHLMNLRIHDLYSATRSEILTSVSAALFFVAVVLWRLGSPADVWQQVGVAVIIVWIVATLYRFRHRIRRAMPPGAFAAPGLDYYRAELRYRRDHLKNAWLWHGPVLLALVILVATVPSYAQFRNALPLVALLVVWLVIGVVRRHSRARQLQRELDELDRSA